MRIDHLPTFAATATRAERINGKMGGRTGFRVPEGLNVCCLYWLCFPFRP